MQDEVDRLVAAWAPRAPGPRRPAARGAEPGDPAGPPPRPGPQHRLRRARASRSGSSTSWPRCAAPARPTSLPRPAAHPDAGHLRHDDQPGRPARADRGLVQRLPDPADRRGVHVRLTPRGKERVDAALADLLSREQELLSALLEPDQESLSGLLRRLVAPFEAEPPAGQAGTKRPSTSAGHHVAGVDLAGQPDVRREAPLHQLGAGRAELAAAAAPGTRAPPPPPRASAPAPGRGRPAGR